MLKIRAWTIQSAVTVTKLLVSEEENFKRSMRSFFKNDYYWSIKRVYCKVTINRFQTDKNGIIHWKQNNFSEKYTFSVNVIFHTKAAKRFKVNTKAFHHKVIVIYRSFYLIYRKQVGYATSKEKRNWRQAHLWQSCFGFRNGNINTEVFCNAIAAVNCFSATRLTAAQGVSLGGRERRPSLCLW